MLKETIQKAIKDVDNIAFFGTGQDKGAISLLKSLDKEVTYVVVDSAEIDKGVSSIEEALTTFTNVIAIVACEVLEDVRFSTFKNNKRVSWWCVTHQHMKPNGKKDPSYLLQWKNNFRDTYDGVCLSYIDGIVVGASKKQL